MTVDGVNTTSRVKSNCSISNDILLSTYSYIRYKYTNITNPKSVNEIHERVYEKAAHTGTFVIFR